MRRGPEVTGRLRVSRIPQTKGEKKAHTSGSPYQARRPSGLWGRFLGATPGLTKRKGSQSSRRRLRSGKGEDLNPGSLGKKSNLSCGGTDQGKRGTGQAGTRHGPGRSRGRGVRLGQLQAREPARLSCPLPVSGHPSASSCSDCSRPSRPVHCRHQRRRHLTLASGRRRHRHRHRLRCLRLRLRCHAFRPRLRRSAGEDGGKSGRASSPLPTLLEGRVRGGA